MIQKYPKEGLVAGFLDYGENYADKAGVIIQFGTRLLFLVHDPVFLEKLAERIPEAVDRFGDHGGAGRHTTGF